MRFIIDKWRRIGTRLYLALGFAVALTLVSAAVGVYYFEQSGNLNYKVRSESVPALEDSWAAAREAERLRSIGQNIQAGEGEFQGSSAEAIDRSLERLETALSGASNVPELTDQAQAVSDAAYDLAEDMDGLAPTWTELRDADETASGFRSTLEGLDVADDHSAEAMLVLGRALQAGDEAELDRLWIEF